MKPTPESDLRALVEWLEDPANGGFHEDTPRARAVKRLREQVDAVPRGSFADVLEVGDLVRWRSQAAGRTKYKRGRVVYVVPPKPGSYAHRWGSGPLVSEVLKEVEQAFPARYKLPDAWRMDPDKRCHRYLIAVPYGGSARTRLYLPRPGQPFEKLAPGAWLGVER